MILESGGHCCVKARRLPQGNRLPALIEPDRYCETGSAGVALGAALKCGTPGAAGALGAPAPWERWVLREPPALLRPCECADRHARSKASPWDLPYHRAGCRLVLIPTDFQGKIRHDVPVMRPCIHREACIIRQRNLDIPLVVLHIDWVRPAHVQFDRASLSSMCVSPKTWLISMSLDREQITRIGPTTCVACRESPLIDISPGSRANSRSVREVWKWTD